MSKLRPALLYVLLAALAVWQVDRKPAKVHAQTSTATLYDCNFTYHFTGSTTQTGQPNSSASRPCIAWRVTFTTTGFVSATVQFETSPDNSSWSAVTNTICSSTVQPPCVTDGANPIPAAKQGTASYRAYGKYVRINVSGVSGSGTGDVVVYGYKGTSASASVGGGGGGGGGVTNVTGTLPITSSGGTTPDIAINTFTGDSGSGGLKGAVPAPASGDAAAGKFLAAGGGWSVPAGGGTVTSVTGTLPITSTGGNTPVIAVNSFTGDSGSGGLKGAVPAPASGDSAAGKFLAAGGGWAIPAGSAARGLSFTVGDPTNSSALTTSSTDYVTIPFGCTISAYNLLVDATDTTLRVKFWKLATGTAIPTVSNSISTAGLGVPSGTAIHSSTTSDFTTLTVSQNDIMAMNVSVANTAKFVNGVLQCQ